MAGQVLGCNSDDDVATDLLGQVPRVGLKAGSLGDLGDRLPCLASIGAPLEDRGRISKLELLRGPLEVQGTKAPDRSIFQRLDPGQRRRAPVNAEPKGGLVANGR